MFIGDKLKELRKQKDMTLAELAQKSGVQIATLSRIENKKMVGTLESHVNIAKILGVDVTALYERIIREEKKIEVETPQTLTDVFTHSDRSSFEILTKNVLNKKMLPTLIRIEEGGRTNTEQQPNGNEKFIFVLEGSVEIHIDEQKLKLHKHNTVYFDSSLPHAFANCGKGTARLLCVQTPVSL